MFLKYVLNTKKETTNILLKSQKHLIFEFAKVFYF